jgi:hypothetical protein
MSRLVLPVQRCNCPAVSCLRFLLLLLLYWICKHAADLFNKDLCTIDPSCTAGVLLQTLSTRTSGK